MHNLPTRKIYILWLMAFIGVLGFPAGAVAEKFSGLVKIGAGELNYMFWDVYEAELYAAEEEFSFSREYALNIRYQRDIEKKQILKSTLKELRKQNAASDEKITQWIARLGSIWQDVKEGDELALLVDATQKSRFTLNGKDLGSVDDPQFAKAFADIWLGEKTSKPDLRDDLLNR